MPDRLSELVRQRALVLEHLAWLDREIASATASGAASPLAPTPPPGIATANLPANLPLVETTRGPAPATGGAPVASATSGAAVPEPEIILDQYRVAPATVKQDVRKGCLLYFAGAFVVLGIIVAILYFTIGTR
jgi:hypothetical protein